MTPIGKPKLKACTPPPKVNLSLNRVKKKARGERGQKQRGKARIKDERTNKGHGTLRRLVSWPQLTMCGTVLRVHWTMRKRYTSVTANGPRKRKDTHQTEKLVQSWSYWPCLKGGKRPRTKDSFWGGNDPAKSSIHGTVLNDDTRSGKRDTRKTGSSKSPNTVPLKGALGPIMKQGSPRRPQGAPTWMSKETKNTTQPRCKSRKPKSPSRQTKRGTREKKRVAATQRPHGCLGKQKGGDALAKTKSTR